MAFGLPEKKACKAAGVTGVTFNDLRGTAVSRLALAGATEAEIANSFPNERPNARNSSGFIPKKT